MKILVLDNYDSFVYNLVHLLHEVQAGEIEVVKNDQISLEAVQGYDKILLSPGPGIPKDSGIMPALIDRYGAEKSIFGVCLGHQAMAEAYGCTLLNIDKPLHGVTSTLEVTEEDYLFHGLPKKFTIGHYHSWVVKPEVTPDLVVTARDEHGQIMALKHRQYDIRGVQFHPESILTEHGKHLIENWVHA